MLVELATLGAPSRPIAAGVCDLPAAVAGRETAAPRFRGGCRACPKNAAAVKNGNPIEGGTPVLLNSIPTDGFNYAVPRRGSRFLVARPPATGPKLRVTVMTNWPPCKLPATVDRDRRRAESGP